MTTTILVMCRVYTYFFTFHDIFAPLCLIALSVYVSLKFTGTLSQKRRLISFIIL
jgi:hypothetical protein